MEKIIVEMSKDLWDKMSLVYENYMCGDLLINIDYTIKEVKIVDDFFKDDPTYQTLKSESNKAYKRLKEYEFKERN